MTHVPSKPSFRPPSRTTILYILRVLHAFVHHVYTYICTYNRTPGPRHICFQNWQHSRCTNHLPKTAFHFNLHWLPSIRKTTSNPISTLLSFVCNCVFNECWCSSIGTRDFDLFARSQWSSIVKYQRYSWSRRPYCLSKHTTSQIT